MKNGFTIWSRQTFESDVFYNKPPEWFKIWFYIVGHVAWKDNNQFKRGEGYFCWSEINGELKGVSQGQYNKFIKWAKSAKQIDTHKTTRGNRILVLNYARFQDISNYEIKDERQAERQAGDKQGTSIIHAIYEEGNNIRNKEERECAFARTPNPKPHHTPELVSGLQTSFPAENPEQNPTEQNKPEAKSKPKPPHNTMTPEHFNQFWQDYPRKENRKTAEQKFLKLPKSLFETIIKSVNQSKQSKNWRDGYIPHASTWINQERWTDEITMTNKEFEDEYERLGHAAFCNVYGMDKLKHINFN